MMCFASGINYVEKVAHCYVVQCRQIVHGQYVVDLSTTECRTFRPKGLRQLRTKLKKLKGISQTVLFACFSITTKEIGRRQPFILIY